jgi:uncharacterized tellurite resistance protein B-like protein
MSLLSRFHDLFDDLFGPADQGPDQDRLTVAALLLLVSRVDGRVLKVEEDGLRVLLQARFGLGPADVDRLIRHVDSLAADADSVTSIGERILHDVAADQRREVLALAFRMAAVDGLVHEFEEDLIWRIGRLLGETDGAIAAVREQALMNLMPRRTHGE